jgi:hypothetical protein
MIAGFVGRRMISVTRRIAVVRSGNYFNELGLIACKPDGPAKSSPIRWCSN